MHTDHYVYALLDSRKPGPFRFGWFVFSHEPFYIGKGRGIRHTMHLKGALKGEKSFKASKIRKILREGFEISTKILKSNLLNSEANALEARMISKIGRGKKGPLTNLTDGGDGTSGYRYTKAQCAERSAQRKAVAKETGILMREVFANMTEEQRRERNAKISHSLRNMDPKKKKKELKRQSEFITGWHASRTPKEKRVWLAAIRKGWATMPAEQREAIRTASSATLKALWAEMSPKEKERRTRHLRNNSEEAEARRIRGISSSWFNRSEEERAEINARRAASISATKQAQNKQRALELHSRRER